MSIKYIYETTLNKIVEEKEIQTREENGKTVTVSIPVKKLVPIKIAIQQPDRKLYRGAELFFSKSLSHYLKEGLMPYSLVAKRYANDGGPLSENEIKRLNELKDSLKSLEKEFMEIITSSVENPEDDIVTSKKKNILFEINQINAEVSAIQDNYSSIFDNTADIKARNDTIEWWSLYLINIDEDNKGYKPIFGQGDPSDREDYAKKLVKLEDFEDKGDLFYSEIIKRMSYLISFWFSAKNQLNKSDFQTMEKLYVDTFPSYKLEENKVDSKIPAIVDNVTA